MPGNDGIVLGLLLGGGALAAWALSRREQAGGESVASMTGGGEGTAPPGTTGEFSFYDPATGQIVSPQDVGFTSVVGPDGLPRESATGVPTMQTDQPVQFSPQFSPAFEDALLKQNEDTNRQIVVEQQKQTRATQLGNAATVGILGAAVAPTAIKIASKTPALLRAAAPVARVAGPVGAGLALGQAGVYALEKSGAFDHVQKFGASTIGKAPAPVQTAVKTVALPLSTIGAVATAAAGRGNVQENVRSAFRGTLVDKGVKGVQKLFGW